MQSPQYCITISITNGCRPACPDNSFCSTNGSCVCVNGYSGTYSAHLQFSSSICVSFPFSILFLKMYLYSLTWIKVHQVRSYCNSFIYSPSYFSKQTILILFILILTKKSRKQLHRFWRSNLHWISVWSGRHAVKQLLLFQPHYP
jgi:hypothetical protein